MTTLDTPNTSVDPRDVPYLPTAVRYGLIGGLIGIVFSMIGNLTGLTEPDGSGGFNVISTLFGLVGFVIFIATGIMAIRFHRDQELGGFATFGRAFMTSFVALFVYGAILGIFSFVYTNFIDPGLLDRILQKTLEGMENQGASAQQIEATMQWLEWWFGLVGNMGFQLGFGVVAWPVFTAALFGLIIGAFTKKVKDEF